MHMTWNDLQTIETLVRRGSIVAAAAELGLRHSTVSRRVDALERALGAPLFLRGPRLQPTALASAIAERAASMAAGAREIGTLVEAAQREREHRLVATTNDVLAPLLFDALAATGGERLVQVRITDVESSLEPGLADLALRPGAKPAGTLRGWRLGRLRIGIFRSVSAPSEGWIHPAAGLRHRSSMRWWKAVPEPRGGGVECDSLLSMRDACAAGLGRAALPALLGRTDTRLRLEAEIEGGPPVWLLLAATRSADRQLRPFAEKLAASLRALPGVWAAS